MARHHQRHHQRKKKSRSYGLTESPDITKVGAPEKEAEEATHDFSDYLRRVRDRTQEVVKAAEELAASKPARTAAAKPNSASTPGMAQGQSLPRISSYAELQDRFRREEPAPLESPMKHLKDSRTKMQELLSRLSVESEQAKAIREQAAMKAASEALANASRRSHDQLQTSPWPPSAQPEPEPGSPVTTSEGGQCPTSPSSWLAQQRQRTETLLGRLRLASATTSTDGSPPVQRSVADGKSIYPSPAALPMIETSVSRPLVWV